MKMKKCVVCPALNNNPPAQCVTDCAGKQHTELRGMISPSSFCFLWPPMLLPDDFVFLTAATFGLFATK